MSNKIPLIVSQTDAQIQELPLGDNLDIGGGQIVNVSGISTSDLTISGNVTADYYIGDGSQLTNLPLGDYSNANVASFLPTYTGNLQVDNITSLGQILTDGVTSLGNVTSGYFIGGAQYLTNLPGSNVIGPVPTATTAVTVTSNAQPNITSVGNLTSLNVVGNVTANYFIGNGSLLSNINAGNLVGAYGNANVAAYLPTYTGILGNASSIAIGNGTSNTGYLGIAIGSYAASSSQGAAAIAIGVQAGQVSQGGTSIAIGQSAGLSSQGVGAIAIGQIAGNTNQGTDSIAIGQTAGWQNQGQNSVAIGPSAGTTGQGNAAVAIGADAGSSNQHINAVAIGAYAGYNGQGNSSIAIGFQAGFSAQTDNSIILNASGNSLSAFNSGLYISPIRNASNANVIYYNPTTFEATYGLAIVPPVTSSVLKGDGAGGFANAIAGTDYAPATSGSSILYGNGAGGFSSVTVGSGLSFVGGNLTATYGNANVAAYLPTYTGNVGGANAVITGVVYANTFSAPNGTFTILSNLDVKGNVTYIESNVVTINDVNIVLANNASNAAQADGGGFTINGANASFTFSAASNNFVSTQGITTNSNIAASYFVGNGSTLSSIAGSNVTGTVANATFATSAGTATSATTAGTVTTNAQPNITSVGTLTSLSVSGNVTTSANISGSYILGNGSQLTGLPAGYGNANLANLGSNAIVTTGNITGNVLTVSSGLITANTVPLVTTPGWTTPTRMNGSATYAVMTSVTVNTAGLFVAVGYDGSQAPLYATSSNGTTWTTPARMNGYSGDVNISSVTVNSTGLFVAVGFNGLGGIPSSGGPAYYATSSNGTTWTTPSRMNGNSAAAAMTSITVNSSGLFVAVGWNSVDASPIYSTSRTGTNGLLQVSGSNVLTSSSSIAYATTAGTVAITGISGLGANVATFLTTPTSANLISAVTDETGSGNLVFNTSPTLVTPILGTPTSGTLSNCTVDGTNKVGFREIPQNAQNVSYGLVLTDDGKHIYNSTGSGITYTIPANSNVAFPLGTAVTFVNMNATALNIAITTDTMYLGGTGTTGTRTLAQYGSATALKITTTSWLITGSGLT